MRQGASYISAAKPQKCYCMGSMNVVLANVALASAGSAGLEPPEQPLVEDTHTYTALSFVILRTNSAGCWL